MGRRTGQVIGALVTLAVVAILFIWAVMPASIWMWEHRPGQSSEQVADNGTNSDNTDTSSDTADSGTTQTESETTFDVGRFCTGDVDVVESVNQGKCVASAAPAPEEQVATFNFKDCTGVIDAEKSLAVGQCVQAEIPFNVASCNEPFDVQASIAADTCVQAETTEQDDPGASGSSDDGDTDNGERTDEGTGNEGGLNGPSDNASADFVTQKCAWLRDNFPQTTEEIQELGARLAGVHESRIRTHGPYRCSSSTNESVFDGFVVLGPNEAHPGMVTMTVAEHGRIDSYDPICGAKYSVPPTEIRGELPNPCDDTWSAYSGKVTALSMTYYPFDDHNPPNQGGTSSSETTDTNQSPAAAAPVVSCMLASDYAGQMKWPLVEPQVESVTKYGGAQVVVTSDAILPQGWEAIVGDLKLKGGDLLTAGTIDDPLTYSIYPPPGECRVQLGVEG